ncbi:energy-coupling factor transporter ATPase [Hornefia butyriciproducens]|uniref:energy-coupling factor transporter ATPase n=1 Tax=Hornefia butyriciproducens TaxID=2652293 RepID=UPI002A90C4CE|nr:energy-coupling factor transporter ATPase [Hornefia butyriciproducens]MCI7413217.1 energy-coupling factor transporter ATPase [Clostridiales bacterium]MCI7679211.1 energy-coupling factor transporter ATPase [Clostridiales bacterium]MDY5423862.1 energy-coupling factor transporter ATPase [Hornefia butyriciproducens]MDY5462065.1 energy-coupling factor transporter ATPase [Hornefia butyriciproducens]MDY6212724.1 energy-coupling factor transporter ATPase [Hornefia butyriciproducens]
MSIQVRNLSYIYNEGLTSETVALDNINFDIYDGEVAGIIGHTGSGKSTLLQQLNGLLKPRGGTIIVGGTDITRPGISMRDVRRRVGLVFQYPEYQLFEETVALDVAFGPKNLGLREDEVDERVRDALELVGLDYDEVAGRSPFELSGGQKRRVAIAGVIAMKPQVLILDEPTAGLDPGSHDEIMAMIRKVHESQQNIILFVSHNMEDVAALSDKVMVMDRGKLITVGTPKEVFRQRDRLAAIALDVPPVTEMMFQLKERGIDVDTGALTLREAEESIYDYLRGSKAK